MTIRQEGYHLWAGSTAAKEGGAEKNCEKEAVKAADRARERGNMMFSQGHFARAESLYKTVPPF